MRKVDQENGQPRALRDAQPTPDAFVFIQMGAIRDRRSDRDCVLWAGLFARVTRDLLDALDRYDRPFLQPLL